MSGVQAGAVLRCDPVDQVTYLWKASSKSLSLRALLLASIADGSSVITQLLMAHDTQACLGSLRRLGGRWQCHPGGDDGDCDTYTTDGTASGLGAMLSSTAGGSAPCLHRSRHVQLALGGSGVTLRLLLALLAARSCGPVVRLDGDPSLRRRSSEPLVGALRDLGYTQIPASAACLPLSLPPGGLRGGGITLSPTISSQFLSALLMAAPFAAAPTEIKLTAPPVSSSYITLTVEMMHRFGMPVWHNEDLTELRVQPGRYQAQRYRVEADMSSVCYLWAWAVIHKVRLAVAQLPRDSSQGDRRFMDVLTQLGCAFHDSEADDQPSWGAKTRTIRIEPPQVLDLATPRHIDLSDMPDQMPTLAVLATLGDAPLTIGGIGVVRGHECDRIAACEDIFRHLGVRTAATESSITIWPMSCPPRVATCIRTYSDHRLAMAFSLLASKYPHIQIAEPHVVAKSFPGFYDMLAELGCVFAVAEDSA